jgi:uroporphyrin-3 C-methyltransferase
MTQSNIEARAQSRSGDSGETSGPEEHDLAESQTIARSSSAGSGLAILAIVLSVLACAASAYSWYTSQVAGRFEIGRELGRMDGLQREVDRLVASGASAESRLIDLSNAGVASREELLDRIDALDGQWNKALASLIDQQKKDNAQHQQEREVLAEILAELSERLGAVQRDWQLEEVANQRLTLTGDVALARSALQMADERLSERADPGILEVRRVIAREITALDQTASDTVVEQAVAIGLLIEQVGQLPLRGEGEQPQWALPAGESSSLTVASDATAEQDKDRTWISRVIDSLAGLVRVRRVDETRAPRLDSSQRFLAYENLRLQLLVSQLAILRRDTELLRSSIDQALAWLDSHFAQSDTLSRFVAQLSDIKATPLGAAPPDVSGSLVLLQEEIKRREQVQ